MFRLVELSDRKTHLSLRLVNQECKVAVDEFLSSHPNTIESIFMIRRSVDKHGKKYTKQSETESQRPIKILPNIEIFSNQNEISIVCEKNLIVSFKINMVISETFRNFIVVWHMNGYPMIVGSGLYDSKKYCFVISFYTDFSIGFEWKILFDHSHLNFGFQVLGLPFTNKNNQDTQIFYNNLSTFFITQKKNNYCEILVQEFLYTDTENSSNSTISISRRLECLNNHFQYTPSNFSPLLFENKAKFAGFLTTPFVFWPKLKIGYTLHERMELHRAENNHNFYFSSQLTIGVSILFCLKSDGNIYYVFSSGTPYTHWNHKLFFLSDDVFISSSLNTTEIILFEIGSHPVISINKFKNYYGSLIIYLIALDSPKILVS